MSLLEIPVQGRFNLLAQAVRAVMLAILPAGLRDQTVNIRISVANLRATIAIGPVPQTSAPDKLDLTVAHQILAEHAGELELRQDEQVQQAILSLPVTKVLGL